MTEEEKRKILMDVNTDDFNVMRSMLTEIEMKIMQLDPLKQRQFYKPIRDIIFEAYMDATNPEDSFLYQNNS